MDPKYCNTIEPDDKHIMLALSSGGHKYPTVCDSPYFSLHKSITFAFPELKAMHTMSLTDSHSKKKKLPLSVYTVAVNV